MLGMVLFGGDAISQHQAAFGVLCTVWGSEGLPLEGLL